MDELKQSALTDIQRWTTSAENYKKALPDKLLGLLSQLKGYDTAFAEDNSIVRVNRYEHSLQSASRALRAGEDDEMVVVCLLHDLGDVYGVENHGSISAAILKPYISAENHWLVEHHIIFQGFYYYDKLGLDKNLRDQYKGHPAYERTIRFCAEYDNPAFDPNYDTLPLSTFEPMVRGLCDRAGYQLRVGTLY